MSETGVWRRPRKGDEMGVFEHFREHPGDRPYRRCPVCGGELRMFRYSRRPGEIAFYCPGCDWNASVTDVDEARGRSLRRAPAVPRRGCACDARWSLRLRGEHGRPLGSPSSPSRSFRNRLCLVSCRPPRAGAEGARDPARRKGGAKAKPLVFQQGGAADRLFRASFAGTALSGGGRARKKPEKHRGPCGEAGPVTGCAHEE